MSEDSDRLVTIKEAAAFLRISERSVRRLIQDGTIPAWKPSPQVIRISMSVLREQVFGAMGVEPPGGREAKALADVPRH